MTAVVPREAISAASAVLGLGEPEVGALPGGVANRSWRLRYPQHDLVLKLAGEAAPGLGASAEAALAMQALASANGLAPPVVLADRARGFILSRYVTGATPSAADMRAAPLLRRVGAFLAALHALPPPTDLPIVDCGARAAGYVAQLPGEFAAFLARELGRRRIALGALARLVPCHHDLHHRNLIDDGERLLAVDWEYAGPGDPAADIAACIGYHDLDGAGREALYAGYGTADAAMRARVVALGWIFDCLCYGWNAVAAGHGLAADPEEQARLAARLAG